MKVLMTVGISASGKTTWANNFIKEREVAGENWININQDDIRLILIKEKKGDNIDEEKEVDLWDHSLNSKEELEMKERWLKTIKKLMKSKDVLKIHGIIISDTNLTKEFREEKIKKLISVGINRENIYLKLIDVTLEEALERDRNRKFSVGEDVIKLQMIEYLKNKKQKYKM